MSMPVVRVTVACSLLKLRLVNVIHFAKEFSVRSFFIRTLVLVNLYFQISPTDPKVLLMGDIDPTGNLNAQGFYNFTEALKFKWAAQVCMYFCQYHQCFFINHYVGH
jgi:hypothetical protein